MNVEKARPQDATKTDKQKPRVLADRYEYIFSELNFLLIYASYWYGSKRCVWKSRILEVPRIIHQGSSFEEHFH